MKQKTDGELVFLTRAGRKQAFGLLVGRYLVLARQIAADRVDNQDVAQELAQEALLQAFLSLDHLREPERFRGWLHGIVLNVCRSYLRDLKADAGLPAALPSNASPDPQAIAEQRERQALVREAMETLSPQNRDAIRLFYDEQCSLQETADALGVSVVAVKGRLHKARRQLRAWLQPLYPDWADALPRKQRGKRMNKVTVLGVYIHQFDGDSAAKHFLLLADDQGRRLRIWVGQAEAWAISTGLTKTPMDRPMTLDFMANLLRETDTQLAGVHIKAIRDETFYAVVTLNVRGETREMDARPSDAIALAVRTDSPLFVAEEIMAQSGTEADGLEEEAAMISFVGVPDAAGMATALIRQAVREHATEITFGFGQAQASVHVLFRINNDLVDKLTLPKPSFALLVTQFKYMADMDTAESTEGQTGEIPIRYDGQDYVLGVNVSPTEYGEVPILRFRP